MTSDLKITAQEGTVLSVIARHRRKSVEELETLLKLLGPNAKSIAEYIIYENPEQESSAWSLAQHYIQWAEICRTV